jgi:hypothetical protein
VQYTRNPDADVASQRAGLLVSLGSLAAVPKVTSQGTMEGLICPCNPDVLPSMFGETSGEISIWMNLQVSLQCRRAQERSGHMLNFPVLRHVLSETTPNRHLREANSGGET